MRRKLSAHRDPNAHIVHAPGKRLLHAVPLAFVRSRAAGQRRRTAAAALNLVSFIDFLVVTVIFLLMQFSASGESQAAQVDVPHAGNVDTLVDAPLVTVVQGQILVDGVAAGSARSIEELGRAERIVPLFDALRAKKELWKQLQPAKEFPGVCVLALDQETPAVVVKSVFQTAAYAGYPNVSFMVKSIRDQP